VARRIADHAADYCPLIGKTRQCQYPQDVDADLCDVRSAKHGEPPSSPACTALLKRSCSLALASGNYTVCSRCIVDVRRAGAGPNASTANCTSHQLSNFCRSVRPGAPTVLRRCAPIGGIPAVFAVATYSTRPRFEDCTWSASPCVYTPYFPPGSAAEGWK
jgi:hypothetical protein